MRTCTCDRRVGLRSRRFDHQEVRLGTSFYLAAAAVVGPAAAAAVAGVVGDASSGWGREAAVVEVMVQHLASVVVVVPVWGIGSPDENDYT
jgi:hypothetical protein